MTTLNVRQDCSCVPLVAKDDLELLTLLSRPLGCWDYRHMPPWLAYIMVG